MNAAPNIEPEAVEHEDERATEAQGDPRPRANVGVLDLVRNEKQQPIPHVANAIEILANDINWRGVLAFDKFKQQVVFRRAPAWFASHAPREDEAVLDDDGEVRLAAWLMKSSYRLKVEKVTAAQAAQVVAKRNEFDSLVDFLDGLVWDSKPRLSMWLTTYLGAADTPYTRSVGRWFLISAVARAYRGGVQVDHALIFEGVQGEGKSALLRALFGERFSESPLDLSNKDRFVNLRGVWCQSFDELAGLLRSENETAKNFITAPVDTYRPPYGRHSVKVLRRCVFAGTVNPGGVGYLKDSTGNRRYWPVACGVVQPIDRAALAAHVDQLWAEAVTAYKAGEKWWPESPEEKALCRKEQASREADTPWDETIGKWLAGHAVDCKTCGARARGAAPDCPACRGTGKLAPFKPSTDARGRRFVTQTDVLSMCLQLPEKEHIRYANSVAEILGRLEWKRPPGGARVKRDGFKVTPYYHPADLANEPERAAIEGRAPFADE